MCDTGDELRRALDIGSATVASLGLRPYEVSIVKVIFSGSTFPSYSVRPGVDRVSKTITSSSVKVGPGYTSNPGFSQLSAKEIFFSNNRYNDSHYKLGPIVSSYGTASTGSFSCSSGGLNSNIFEPTTGLSGSVSQETWIKVEGPGMETSGSFFEIVRRQEDSSLSYTVYLKHTGQRVC